jgi:hypothetical protein
MPQYITGSHMTQVWPLERKRVLEYPGKLHKKTSSVVFLFDLLLLPTGQDAWMWVSSM